MIWSPVKIVVVAAIVSLLFAGRGARGIYKRSTNVCVVRRVQRCGTTPLSRQRCLQLGCCYRYSFWKGSLCYKPNVVVKPSQPSQTTSTSAEPPAIYRRNNPRKSAPVSSTTTPAMTLERSTTSSTAATTDPTISSSSVATSKVRPEIAMTLQEKQKSVFLSLLEKMVVNNLMREASTSSGGRQQNRFCPGGVHYPIQSCGGARATPQWCSAIGCCWILSFISNTGRCVIASGTVTNRYINNNIEITAREIARPVKHSANLTPTIESQSQPKRTEGIINERSLSQGGGSAQIGSSRPSYNRPTEVENQNVVAPVVTAQQKDQIRTFEKILTIADDNAQIVSDTICALSRKDSCCLFSPNSPCCVINHDPEKRPPPSTRVVGGGPAGRLRTSMAFLSRGPFAQGFCGGTLISNNWVLTAAHCVLDYCSGNRRLALMVSLGKTSKNPYVKNEGQQDIFVKHVICHPMQCKLKQQPRLNDLALLRLQRPAYVSSTVSPAAIPLQYEEPPKFSNCITLGYGMTRGSGHGQVLKEVSVPLITNQICNQPSWRNCVVRPCMMCASDHNAAPCDGDSGGPLFCPRANGMYVLHGVYSWGRCGIEREKPSVFTRTAYFVDWIIETVHKMS